MGYVRAFQYFSGKSLLHGVEVRCKIICLCLLSISLVSAEFPELIVFSAIIFLLIGTTGITAGSLIRDLKYFLMLLLGIFLTRVLTTPGPSLVTWKGISLSLPGLVDGTQVVWRFLLIMFLGILFTVTTRPSEVKAAVQWFLKPVPLIPEKRAGTMVGLFLRFLPLILKQAEEINLAWNARCGNLRKNPFQRIAMTCIPLMKRIFATSDRLTMAMISRCYTDDGTDAPFTPSGHESVCFVCAAALTAWRFLL